MIQLVQVAIYQLQMFNVLITFDSKAWETDQLMRMDKTRFLEYSERAPKSLSAQEPEALKKLENIPTLLMYEVGSTGPNVEIVRYGQIFDISVSKTDIAFRFEQTGQFSRKDVLEFSDRLGFGRWEESRTHWAVKDGELPRALLDKLQKSYDVVFSFAGEDRKYVENVARYLRSKGIKVFYDLDEEAHLWGKDLAEHFESVYGHGGQYCIMFISKAYVEKMWARHERRSAMGRSLQESREYILPARFDDTKVPGIPTTTAYISLSGKKPTELAKLILQKLGKDSI